MMLTLGLVVAAVFTFVTVLTAVYAQSVVSAAADEAARAGSRVGAGSGACEVKAAEAVRSLMPGRLSDSLVVGCGADGAQLVATVQVSWDSPVPALPTFNLSASSRMMQEQ